MPLAERRAARRGGVRVATYNIHKGVYRDFFGLRRIERIHELRERVHALQADLVFLQEVQGRNERNAARFASWPEQPQAEFLAASGGPRRPAFEASYGLNARYLHGHHGNALLSRYPIVHSDNRDVSDHALERRGILHCVIEIESRRVHCFVVHFGLLARSRERQLQALIDWIEHEIPFEEPLIIAGDFNDWLNRLTGPLCARLAVQEVCESQPARARLRPARTFPALIPWLRMDRIYQRGFEVGGVRVLRGPRWAHLSDHSPVVADLRLRG